MPQNVAPCLLPRLISIRFLFAMMSARSAAVLFVSRNDSLHQRMADDVPFGEFDNSNTFGGTHFVNPREISAQLAYKFRY